MIDYFNRTSYDKNNLYKNVKRMLSKLRVVLTTEGDVEDSVENETDNANDDIQ